MPDSPNEPVAPTAPKITPGDIAGWPILKIDYRTDPERIAALLPDGIEPSDSPRVHVHFYQAPVPDEPEYGLQLTVDADYQGMKGRYAVAYGIDQESAIFISREINGQPKFPCDLTYYRMGDRVTARCSHQGYTFIEFHGKIAEPVPERPDYSEDEWWIKVSRAVGGAAKRYDFPPHVVRVHTEFGTAYLEPIDGELTLRESPWDPIQELLPMRELLSARLDTPTFRARAISLEGALDPDAFWPYADTIGGSRWLGQNGGPIRTR